MIKSADQVRAHYEAHGALLLDDCGLDYHAEFIHRPSFPPEWKKFGTVNGLTIGRLSHPRPAALRRGCELIVRNPASLTPGGRR